MCSLVSEMWTDGHDSVCSFHTSCAKNVQRKTGEWAARETDAGAYQEYFRNNIIITIKEFRPQWPKITSILEMLHIGPKFCQFKIRLK
jgi:hypothetical protein